MSSESAICGTGVQLERVAAGYSNLGVNMGHRLFPREARGPNSPHSDELSQGLSVAS